jgi:hypothetical protein
MKGYNLKKEREKANEKEKNLSGEKSEGGGKWTSVLRVRRTPLLERKKA